MDPYETHAWRAETQTTQESAEKLREMCLLVRDLPPKIILASGTPMMSGAEFDEVVKLVLPRQEN